MKKIKISSFVILAVVSASLSAFTTKSPKIVAGWYGQTKDAVPPYNTSNFINTSSLNTVCPTGSAAHLCAAYLKSDGTLDGTQSPNTRMSAHNYQ